MWYSPKSIEIRWGIHDLVSPGAKICNFHTFHTFSYFYGFSRFSSNTDFSDFVKIMKKAPFHAPGWKPWFCSRDLPSRIEKVRGQPKMQI